MNTPVSSIANNVYAPKINQPHVNASSNNKPSLWEKISKVVQIIFQTALNLFLYRLNPSIFAIGFFIGVFADEWVIKQLNKIRDVWNAQPWSICVIGGMAAALSLPVALGAGSLIMGAHLGSTLSYEAQKILRELREKKSLLELVRKEPIPEQKETKDISEDTPKTPIATLK